MGIFIAHPQEEHERDELDKLLRHQCENHWQHCHYGDCAFPNQVTANYPELLENRHQCQ